MIHKLFIIKLVRRKERNYNRSRDRHGEIVDITLVGDCSMQVNPIRNSTMPAGAWRSWSMTLGNDRHFLHGKQKRAPTNFARGSITRHGEQLVLSRGSLLLIVSLSLSA